jgi:uncharacterized protein
MTNNTKSLLAVFVLLILLVGVVAYFATKDSDITAKSSPIDPAVTEQLRQAKILQETGHLKEAFTIYEQLSLMGHPEAMFYTGKFFSRGWAVSPNLDKARFYFHMAAEYSFRHRGETAYNLGRLYQRSIGEDCNEVAIEWFETALKWNYRKAALQLAVHYEYGLGVNPDIDQALKYYRIAIEVGIEKAMLHYALIVRAGKYGIPTDPATSASLTRQAIAILSRKAQAGSASAAKQIGRLYYDGHLIPKNIDLAKEWLLRSAHLGSMGGMHDIALMLLADDVDPEKRKEGLKWLQKAAIRGHGGAITTLGRLHKNGQLGLHPDKAVTWFQKGVAVGHPGSMEELARLYFEGKLIRKDLTKAQKLAQKGAKKGHSGSKSLLKELLSISTNSISDKPQLAAMRR